MKRMHWRTEQILEWAYDIGGLNKPAYFAGDGGRGTDHWSERHNEFLNFNTWEDKRGDAARLKSLVSKGFMRVHNNCFYYVLEDGALYLKQMYEEIK